MTIESSEKTDLAMEWLASEIRESAKKGQVRQLSEVWKRYCELAQKPRLKYQHHLEAGELHYIQRKTSSICKGFI